MFLDSLQTLWDNLLQYALALRWQDVLDVAIVSFVLYKLFSFIKETRAVQLIRGFLILVIIYFIANNFLELKILTAILQNATTLVIVAIPVLFQPELRRALSELGRGMSIFSSDRFLKGKEFFDLINTLANTARELSDKRTGALIVIERKIGLSEYIESGTSMDSEISRELIISIFQPGTPLHDGAIILRGSRIMAASVVLPLTEMLKSPAGIYWGTRHRAAIGITEVSDAACLVISEETGSISIIIEGKVHRNLTEDTLHRQLVEIFQMGPEPKEVGFIKALLKNRRYRTGELPLMNPGRNKWLTKLREFSSVFLFNLRFIAVAIAIIWFLAINNEGGAPLPRPFESHKREVMIPIQVQGASENLVVKLEPKLAQIELNGQAGSLQNLQPKDIQAYIVLEDTSTGEQLLPVGVLPPPDVQFNLINPTLVKVKIINLK